MKSRENKQKCNSTDNMMKVFQEKRTTYKQIDNGIFFLSISNTCYLVHPLSMLFAHNSSCTFQTDKERGRQTHMQKLTSVLCCFPETTYPIPSDCNIVEPHHNTESQTAVIGVLSPVNHVGLYQG